MKKMFKKLAALAMAAVMMVGMGAAALAVDAGTYTVDAKLYKDAACTSSSMGNLGIKSITATYSNDGTVDIALETRSLSYGGDTGVLSAFSLYNADTEEYMTATQDDLTFTIENFPADQFQAGSVVEGQFTTAIEAMGQQTGYLKVTGLTPVAAS